MSPKRYPRLWWDRGLNLGTDRRRIQINNGGGVSRGEGPNPFSASAVMSFWSYRRQRGHPPRPNGHLQLGR